MVSRLKKRKNHSSFPNEESVNLKRVEEMAKECAKLDVEEERGDEFELNLELSIGGMYRQENSKGKITKFSQENVNGETTNFVISRSNFPNGVAENVHEHMDLQRRKEIQALRRQEARRKREEKIKKAKRQKDGVGLAEEAKKLKARVEERESRERDCFSEEKPRKKDKNSSNAAADDLSLSLFTDDKISTQQVEREFLYPKVQPHDGFRYSCGVFPSPVDCNSECRNKINDGRYRITASYKSLEQCSSAVSDYLSMSHKGGSSSDTGSHSSLQPQSISRSAFDQLESHDSSSQAETDQVLGGPKLSQSKPDPFLDQTNNASSTRLTSCRLNEKPPNPSNYNRINAASFPRMPCVSATGNGPNGRTIMGFLYKYTKAEVSIVCVCHGSSFSPAEFVEHAGGVDISQPLKHITVVPSAFG